MRINGGRKQQGPPPGPPPQHPPLSGGPNDPPPIALHALLATLMPEVLLALAAQAVQGQPQQNLPRQNHIPQSLPPSGQHAIQPDLETASDVQALQGICENLQLEVNRLKRAHQDDGDEADYEDEPVDKGVRQKKKKKLAKGKIRTYLLNRPLQELSAAEKTTREELQECLDAAIFDVTGTSMDTIETDESNGGDGGEDPREGEKLQFAFGGDKGVQALRNKKIIDRAANIVWNEQHDHDAETCTLGHKDVSFTKKDIVAFAKDKFRNLKRKYAEVTDSSKRAKRQKQKVVNKRKKRHPSVIEAYTKEYGADPTLLLETEYMSEEISELETDNKEKKKAHHKILLQKAGFVGSDEEDAVVWEVVRQEWRSKDFNDIVERIDKIRRRLRHEAKNKRVHTKRVNIGTVKDNAPEIPVLAKFNLENPGASLDIKTSNPRGFGPKDDQPDTQEQENDGPGTTPEYGGGEANYGDDMDYGDM
ncbi:hypothetical protein DEU56DRAFT_914036 [Suillus clintonianus]|uniref:uncharacterized protein n=1 Tax=Suillus clintonianus TaxID=1904413 RepID=UPI001B87844F|nr:uncharacterized protein DEU56DRAFT_914036 [Suillus clintonianus]KAG2133011.1 hypothetical protein DEU56DRAFT_914036 [Suillus clintonianus]